MINLDIFSLNENSSVTDALSQIELNTKGFTLITDNCNCVTGIVTDGDIRRKLIEGIKLEDPIKLCSNNQFVKANSDTPRELLLKQLDHKIKVIPVLDSENRLITIVTKDYLPEMEEQKVYFRSKSPVRISFGGGGSDTSTFFTENDGAVINATISLYSHATLKIRENETILILELIYF